MGHRNLLIYSKCLSSVEGTEVGTPERKTKNPTVSVHAQNNEQPCGCAKARFGPDCQMRPRPRMAKLIQLLKELSGYDQF